MNQDQVQKRYYKEFFIAIGGYVVILIGSISIIKYITLPQPAQVLIAILPMVPIIFIIIAIMRGMRDSDELQQKIQSYAIMFSAVATGLITFSYGLLENVGFPPFPTIWVLPMMFMFWGFSLSYFWKKY
ncbi:MAG TPA: hypothetical protein PKJ84_12260, partial [Anaerolineales bacterium]|nr:hypothetical protein [Anaerolineales bacterium]